MPDGPPPDRNADRGPRGGPGGPRRPPERLLEDLDLKRAANADLPDDALPIFAGDDFVGAPGTYAAKAAENAGTWLMQAVAFRVP